THFDSLDALFIDQIQDIYDAEQRLTKALPKMAKAASNAQLKNAFEHHLQETQQQVNRLEQVFELIGQKPTSKTCDAMKGLISEGEDVIGATGDDAVRDVALIAAAQRVDHYEMAAYGSARSFALRLSRQDAADLLQQSLDEEGAADHKLTEIAEST